MAEPTYFDLDELIKRLRDVSPNISKKKAAEIVGEQLSKAPLNKPDVLGAMAKGVEKYGGKAARVAGRAAPVAAMVLGSDSAEAPDMKPGERFMTQEEMITKGGAAPIDDRPVFDRVKSNLRKREKEMSSQRAGEQSVFERTSKKVREKVERGELSTEAPSVAPEARVAASPVVAEAPLEPVKPAPAAVEKPAEPERSPAAVASKEEPDHLAGALLALAPTALGGIFGGWRGGAIGADVGGRAAGQYYGGIERRNETAAERAFKVSEAEAQRAGRMKELEFSAGKDLEIEKMRAKRDAEKAASERALKERELNLKEKDLGITSRIAALKAAGAQSKGAAGRPIPAASAKSIAGVDASLSYLDEMEAFIKENSGVIGPVAGKAAKIPLVGGYTEASKVQSKLNAYRQKIGSPLEGGVLKEGDWKKYEILLPNAEDNPEHALAKIETIRSILRELKNKEISAYEKSGYNVGQFSPAETANVSEEEALDRLLEMLQ